MSSASLALTLALVQLALFGLCWLLVALLLTSERAPARLFMGACACDALTGWLQVTHGGSLHPVAGMLMSLALCSACLVSAGADAFVHARVRHVRTWLGLMTAGMAAIWLPWPAAQADLLALAGYQTLFLALLILPVWWLWRPVGAEFGRLGWLALLPFVLMALAVAAFLVHLLLSPEAVLRSHAARTDEGASSLIPLAITSGLFHISWLGMALGRQAVQARRLARVDTLTGVLRRGVFEQEVAASLALARRLEQPLTIAFVDVDHFKRINDSGGHAAGDRVLRALGEVLRQTLRSTDRCGRWGGEEFVVLLPGVAQDHAHATLERLRLAVVQARIPVPASCPPLSVSIGYASRDRLREETAAALIDRADRAMYAAKQAGRDRVIGRAGDVTAAQDAFGARTVLRVDPGMQHRAA